MKTLFDKNGPLSQAIENYRPRDGQIAMAEAVAENCGRQVLEAGTGTGKTFAYLVPIIRLGLSAIISTGTRALQDQLFLRDIPFLSKALQRPVRAAMLKGRSNYLCRRNLAAPAQSQIFNDEDDDWRRIVAFAEADEDGDIRGAASVPASSPAWAAAVSSRDTCPVQACDFYDKCFLYRARARAKQADIVVVNHHLFLADMRLREEAVAELLPNRDIVVFDEAHMLPSLAPAYFGETLSTADMARILADIERRQTAHELPAAFVALARQWRAAIGALSAAAENFSGNSVAAHDVLASADWMNAAAHLQQAMNSAGDSAVDNASQSEWFAAAATRIVGAAQQLQRWLRLAADCRQSANADADVEEVPFVCWLEKNHRGGLTLHAAPVSGREIFRRAWQNCKNVLMTSATLTVSGSFERFKEETGMDEARSQAWTSPFDYANRAILYQPPNMPAPNDAAYTEAVMRAALPLVRANRGRAFILFSSWRALNRGVLLLAGLAADGYRIFKQGDAPNDSLLRQFCQTPQAVLAGTLSFWQGVDVRGGALSLVVVDKIPFTPPTDPLMQARDTWRKKRGEEPFMHNQLPAAAILMKQVAGRLMRDFDDWGVFVACDPRLSSRNYGRMILNSLPPMKKTADSATACDFLRRMRQPPNNGGATVL